MSHWILIQIEYFENIAEKLHLTFVAEQKTDGSNQSRIIAPTSMN
ncbi:hypothetical protein CLV98_101696 [Dyadobacter jejuensis]|uniref:Uncharacterized protein n=1 Tax=Dyadobacter jejuensis TaxID=1082580 RepID=A0A316ASC3_9BACT|nr:hypothetical protein CLV98_101696 [Dyadobacter jejuensis]